MNGSSQGLIRWLAVLGLIALAALVCPPKVQAESIDAFLQRHEGKTWKGKADQNYFGFYSISCRSGVLTAWGYEDGRLEAQWSKRPEGPTFVVRVWDGSRTYEISEDGRRITEIFRDDTGEHRNSYVLQ